MGIAVYLKRGSWLSIIFFFSFSFALILAAQESEFQKGKEAKDIEAKVDEYVRPYRKWIAVFDCRRFK